MGEASASCENVPLRNLPLTFSYDSDRGGGNFTRKMQVQNCRCKLQQSWGRLAQEIRVGQPYSKNGGILHLQDARAMQIAAVLGRLAQVPHP